MKTTTLDAKIRPMTRDDLNAVSTIDRESGGPTFLSCPTARPLCSFFENGTRLVVSRSCTRAYYHCCVSEDSPPRTGQEGVSTVALKGDN